MPIYQVVVRQTFLGQQLRNVYYYETTDELDTPQKAEVAEEIATAYDTLLGLEGLSDEWSSQGIDIRRVDVADLPTAQFDYLGGDLVGVHTANQALPAQVAILLRGTADTTFPRNTRIYHGGLHAGMMQQSTGLFTTDIVNDFDLFILQMDNHVITGDSLSRVAVHWDSTNNIVDDWNLVSNYSVAFNPVIQRRRRIGSGI